MTTNFNHPATVVEKRMVHDSLFTIKFSTKEKIPFVAGQYFSIVLPGKRPVPLSIASSESAEHIEFGITIKGDNTRAISELNPGDEAILRGPFGRFTLGDCKKACFIAAGTGVTPFMSMMRTIYDASSDVDAIMLYSTKSKQDLLWPELLHMSQVYVTFTQDAASGQSFGRINEQFLRKHVPDIDTRTFFLCGTPDFMIAMMDLLVSLGVDRERILREAW
jgi:ferredoxin-NADP reductase